MTALEHMSPEAWDARRTEDNKVAVMDVITSLTGKSRQYASMFYNRIVEEQRVPACETRLLPPKPANLNVSSTRSSSHGGARPQETPIATAAEMINIIWELPGSADFRRNCAKVTVRYLGGDESLVDEIRRNRAAQARLAVEQPSHPARVFGRAVEAETRAASPQSVRRRRLENDELELRVLKRARQTLIDAGQEPDAAQEWSFRDRVSNILRGEGSVEQGQLTIHAAAYLLDEKKHTAAEVRKIRSKFGRLAAQAKRRREGLAADAELPRSLKNVDGHVASVVVYRFPEERATLEEAYSELVETDVYRRAVAR